MTEGRIIHKAMIHTERPYCGDVGFSAYHWTHVNCADCIAIKIKADKDRIAATSRRIYAEKLREKNRILESEVE